MDEKDPLMVLKVKLIGNSTVKMSVVKAHRHLLYNKNAMTLTHQGIGLAIYVHGTFTIGDERIRIPTYKKIHPDRASYHTFKNDGHRRAWLKAAANGLLAFVDHYNGNKDDEKTHHLVLNGEYWIIRQKD